MISASKPQMLPRPDEVPNEAVEMTAEEKRRHALMILDAVKKDITSEKLPPAIENLINAYERMGQNEHATLPQTITDNILKLKSIADDKLVKIQDGKSFMGKIKNLSDRVPDRLRDWVSNKYQHVILNGLQTTRNSSDEHLQPSLNRDYARPGHASAREEVAEGVQMVNASATQPSSELDYSCRAWQGHASAREEVAQVVQMVNASVMQPSSELDYELENGERVSEVVSLSRSVNYSLESELARFKEAVRAADNFDRVCHSAFGFSFYSEEFGSFCMLMADTDRESDPTRLESIVRAVKSDSKREHMRQMTRDHNLRNLFRRLKPYVLKDHLYKIIALVFVNEILAAIPVNYKQRSTELYLESLQLACDVFLRTQLTDFSSNSSLRSGIQNLMEKLHLIKFCTM